MNFIKRSILLLLIFVFFLTAPRSGFASSNAPLAPSALEEAAISVYLPAILRPAPITAPVYPDTRRVNVPYFETQVPFSQAAIFWFGKISSSENYADVRVGYTSTALLVRVSVFDRLLWIDRSPTPADLLNWDAVSLMLDTATVPNQHLTPTAYRFDAQLSEMAVDRTDRQAAYRGNNGVWQLSNIPFTTTSGYRWESSTTGGLNNGENNRGWMLTYEIPFNSLGQAAPPLPGQIWKIGILLADRESETSSVVDLKNWPESISTTFPTTWGEIHFGLADYAAPPIPVAGSTTIREGLNGAVVPDAALGGTIQSFVNFHCPFDPSFIWNEWADVNYGSAPDFSIQNQADLADWPCFSKYYVTFPLEQIPAGKVILDAQLILHQFGGSDPTDAENSLIQILSVREDWNESTITWNNAPLPVENIAQTWVIPTVFPGWPGLAYYWDVSLAAARAYANGEPLRLAVYSADGAIHSGKYFVSSEGGDWDAGQVSRPTLTIQWGNP
jgi:hypothetical protein